MRINDLNTRGTLVAETGTASPAQKIGHSDSTRAATVSSSEDRVELSSTLAQGPQAMSAPDTERASRIQALAAQYQSGQYRSDSLATSQAMLEQAFSA
jgi:anti-sigma28 factor (negative regulator of flagellin synthesis)